MCDKIHFCSAPSEIKIGRHILYMLFYSEFPLCLIDAFERIRYKNDMSIASLSPVTHWAFNSWSDVLVYLERHDELTSKLKEQLMPYIFGSKAD